MPPGRHTGIYAWGFPPPLPPRRTMRMLEGRMGPVLLHNTASEIHKLYTRAAREEPHHAPNIQEAQDLNSYLHLWNAHKQEKSDLIRIAMKGWRPPVWAAEAAKQKKLALREKGKAQAAQQKGNSIRKPVRVRPLLSYHYLPLSSVKMLSRCIRMVHQQTQENSIVVIVDIDFIGKL